jgi:GntR family transcriptional regulator
MEFTSKESIYSQIMCYLKRQIYSGSFEAGEKLPAIRDLAVELMVNPSTIVRAYAELEGEGLIYTQSTSGKYVITDEKKLAQMRTKFIISQSKGFFADAKACGLTKSEVLEIVREEYEK